MHKKLEKILIIFGIIIFLIGSCLFLIKFYTIKEPNFYSLAAFLILLFSIILFYNKIDEFSFSKEGLRFKLKDIDNTFKKTEKAEERKKLLQKSVYKDINLEIKKGV